MKSDIPDVSLGFLKGVRVSCSIVPVRKLIEMKNHSCCDIFIFHQQSLNFQNQAVLLQTLNLNSINFRHQKV